MFVPPSFIADALARLIGGGDRASEKAGSTSDEATPGAPGDRARHAGDEGGSAAAVAHEECIAGSEDRSGAQSVFRSTNPRANAKRS